jgi:hypothetical protein
MSTPWRFYVYELASSDGVVQYVGKGSGKRLSAQIRNIGFQGSEVARFKSEKDAYAFEVARIAEAKPLLNKCAGGNGNTATPVKRPVKTAWEREYERVGSRVMAARLLMRFASHLVEPSNLDAIRQISHG